MQLSLTSLIVGLACGQTPADYQTANFVIQAESPEVAKLVGESAESCRKDLVKQWLGKEPAAWSGPCRIHVSLSMGRVGGFTDITFSKGLVRSQKVEVEGPLDRILKGPLPHELAHVLFAHHFGAQPPRWADEGGAILSEGEYQGERQSKILRKILAEGKCFPLRRFFAMQQYPDDIPCLYAQGHSVSRFLVDAKGRKVFLAFVKGGVEGSWDDAVQEQYGYQNVEQLEKAWLTWVEKQAGSGPAATPERVNGRRAAASPGNAAGQLGMLPNSQMLSPRSLSGRSTISN
jgi:hypothetical protein